MKKTQWYDGEEEYEENWDRRPPRQRRQVNRSPRKNDRSPRENDRPSRRNDRSLRDDDRYLREEVASRHKGKKRKAGRRRKKSQGKRFLIRLLLLFLLLFGGLYFMVGIAYSHVQYEVIDSLKDAPVKEDGVINILLIGNDSRENGEDGRSDAMILLTISSKAKKIYMTSLLRDLYVDIPGHEGNRLNAAYSFGGPELLLETIEKNFDITVNRYVLVNFDAFVSLVDAVGGVDLELSKEEIVYVNGYLVEYNILTDRPQGTDNLDTEVQGLIHLNGPQALAYSRNRYLGTDFGRTQRQRKVLSQIIKKLPKVAIRHPKTIINGLFPHLTTNLKKNECFVLCLKAIGYLRYEIEQNSIPLPGSYRDATIRGMAVLQVDFDSIKEYFQEKVYHPQG